jgi:uncharacterized lipoprotein YmbA
MIKRSRFITGCIFLSLLLSACGSSPPVRYFSLSSTVDGGEQDTDATVVLGLGPMRMAQYLDRSQIVTRGEGAELNVDEFSRWAEPLEVAFHRVVSTDVDNMMAGVTVLSFPWQSAVQAQVDYRVLGDVIRFDADQAGLVVLETQWGIMAADSDKWLVPPQRTRYEVQTESPDDPAAVALAMNEVLAKFSRDIAGEMQVLLQE